MFCSSVFFFFCSIDEPVVWNGLSFCFECGVRENNPLFKKESKPVDHSDIYAHNDVGNERRMCLRHNTRMRLK